MKAKLRRFRNTLITSIALAGATVVQAGTLANCDETSLRTAISQGGTISIECDGVVSLTGTLVITNEVTLDGTGHHATISGGNSNRVFEVLPGASLTLVNIAVAHGRSTNGGGILNEGRLTLIGCLIATNTAQGISGTNGVKGTNGVVSTASNPVPLTPGGNGSDGEAGHDARGGGIHNKGTLTITSSRFLGNQALGGTGGNAGMGGGAGYGVDGFGRIRVCHSPGLAGNAGKGGDALGAALCNEGQATVTGTTFAENSARGGSGGWGGVGGVVPCAFMPLTFTPAGRGGSASGGAWFNSGSLRIEKSLLTRNIAWGGAGGDAPEVSGNMGTAPGGMGGNGFGGAGSDLGTNSLIDSTLEANQAKGGNSGFSSHASTFGCPYKGADGGDGLGGALFANSPIHLQNVTIWENQVEGGRAVATFPAGCPAEPNDQSYFLGTNGHALGNSLFTSNTIAVGNSILGGSIPSNQCVGPISDLGHNLNSDSSAVFTAATSRNNIDPFLGALADNGGPTRTRTPLPGSPAIDAGDDSSAPATDQRGVPRPQGTRTDIGAVEATFLTIKRLSGGSAQLRYGGIPEIPYTLEATPRLGDPWSEVETKTAGPTGTIQYTPVPSGIGERFFRVRSP